MRLPTLVSAPAFPASHFAENRAIPVVLQGCSDYTNSDLKKIADANPVGCATLSGARASNCTNAHDIVNDRCGPANCIDKKACLAARQQTMGYFNAEIRTLEGCRDGAWKKDKAKKALANNALTKLQSGHSGHQTQIDLVANWIANHC